MTKPPPWVPHWLLDCSGKVPAPSWRNPAVCWPPKLASLEDCGGDSFRRGIRRARGCFTGCSRHAQGAPPGQLPATAQLVTAGCCTDSAEPVWLGRAHVAPGSGGDG